MPVETEAQPTMKIYNPRQIGVEEARSRIEEGFKPGDDQPGEDLGHEPMRSWELDPLNFKMFVRHYGASSPDARFQHLTAKLLDKSVHPDRKKRLACYVIWYEATKGLDKKCAREAYLHLFPNVKGTA